MVGWFVSYQQFLLAQGITGSQQCDDAMAYSGEYPAWDLQDEILWTQSEAGLSQAGRHTSI